MRVVYQQVVYWLLHCIGCEIWHCRLRQLVLISLYILRSGSAILYCLGSAAAVLFKLAASVSAAAVFSAPATLRRLSCRRNARTQPLPLADHDQSAAVPSPAGPPAYQPLCLSLSPCPFLPVCFCLSVSGSVSACLGLSKSVSACLGLSLPV